MRVEVMEMRTYWVLMQEKLGRLYEAGIRGIEADVTYQPNGERRVSWTAWGPDGFPADWRELGLKEALDEVVHELMWEDDDLTYVHLYPRGYKIVRCSLGPTGKREWKVEVRREPGGDVPQRHFAWTRPLRERLEYLVTKYPSWYKHEAPRAWREKYGPEPTLEALLAWGKGRGEWSALEEPLVPGLLQEALK